MASPALPVLQELLATEESSLLTRFMESTVFVSPPSAGEYTLLQRIAGECQEHRGWLVDLIGRMGGAPGPRRGDVRSADLHFLDLGFAARRLLASFEEVVRKYEVASTKVAADPEASRLVARILARNQAGLAALRQLATASSPSSAT